MTIGIRGPWAKTERDQAGTVIAILPLVEHALDVAAAFEAVLGAGAWGRILAALAGRELTRRDLARLIVLVALHDVGKANCGFQARLRPGAEMVGHTGVVSALVFEPKLRDTAAGRELAHMFRSWNALPYLSAALAHHGRPLVEFGPRDGKEPWVKWMSHWQAADGYDPVAEVAALIAVVRTRWPEAWEDGEPLPRAPRFLSLFCGLVTLADWLGSDTRRLPIAGPHGAARDVLRAEQMRAAVVERGLAPSDTPPGDFQGAFGFPPHGAQQAAAAGDLGPVALIEAETGSGKTEAAIWRWAELRRRGLVDGLFFALPTRTAAVQLHARVNKALGDIFGQDMLKAILAVPGYLRVGDAEGQALPDFQVRWDDGGDDGRWAAERANRFLAARVGVGTIDQALLGALQVKHAHLRAAMLSRSLLVVDEVHASDAYMAGLLEVLLRNHVAAGGHALLLSATLGGAARARFLGQPAPSLEEAVAAPYPGLSGSAAAPRPVPATGRSKTVAIEVAPIIDDADAIAARAVAAARAGASVLVVRNSVGGAVAVARAVEAAAPDLAFRVEGVATLHHGRFAPDDRRRLDAAVERDFGKARTAAGRVLVGTQTLEQSLDIDADLLVTDLAPMDVLLQRIGRLHRHARQDRGAFAEARVVVLRPAERDLSVLHRRSVHGLGFARDEPRAYPNVVQLEATLRLLEAGGTIAIPADNRRLVEQALHPEALEAIEDALGTDWANHAAACAGLDYAHRGTARQVALDMGVHFNTLVFPGREETVASRLGARDLLVDIDPPLRGPFGHAVDRIAIPSWMAKGIAPDAAFEPLGGDTDGQRFALGERRYVYGRWGLAADAA